MIDFKEFCDIVGEVYDELPKVIRDTGFGIMCEELPTPASREAAKSGTAIFGYYTSLFGNSVMMCYWGFKMIDKFDREHIENVMKHEFEHMLAGKTLSPAKHSEHHD